MLARRPMASSRVMFVMAVVWVWHYQGLASIGSVFLKVLFCYFDSIYDIVAFGESCGASRGYFLIC